MRTNGLSIPGAVGQPCNPVHFGDAPLERSHLESARYLLLDHFAGAPGNVCSSLVQKNVCHT